MNEFRYCDGMDMASGDRIGIDNLDGSGIAIQGTVAGIIMPGTSEAEIHACFDTGGVMLELDNGDKQLWTSIDEHLVFLGRL